jgi:DNA-binding NtrC family response regulator
MLHREFLLADGDMIEFAGAGATASLATDVRFVYESDSFEQGFSAAKARILAEFEHRFLRWAMARSGGNVSAAARRAGKERRNFGRLLKKHGIDRAQYAND